MEIVNRKSKFNYEFTETYIAGIVLKGSEIKAVRDGHVSIGEAYCYFVGNELFLKNAIITVNPKVNNFVRSHPDTIYGASASSDRKLLLNKNELLKIKSAIDIKGMTVVPYKMFINDKGFCKLEIAVAKGKKTYDKRETIKKRDIERDMKREM